MKDRIFCIKLTDRSGTPEISSELLSGAGFRTSSHVDCEKKETYHILYFNSAADARRAVGSIRKSLGRGKDFRHGIFSASLFQLKKEDWTEAWKKHFKIMRIGRKTVIKPGWLSYRPRRKDEVVVEIDPGMSFGTGKHATTRFCLKMIERIASETSPEKRKSFLDAGCGSGILSIAAAKFGFSPVVALDIDPEAAETTRENLEINGVGPKTAKVFSADFANFRSAGKFDVIAANIISGALIEHRRKLFSLLKPGGFLIVSGILKDEFSVFRKKFTAPGIREMLSSTEHEWKSAMFRKNP